MLLNVHMIDNDKKKQPKIDTANFEMVDSFLSSNDRLCVL